MTQLADTISSTWVWSPSLRRLNPVNLYKVSNDGKIGIISKGNNLLVDHKSKDTHHGGTAVVKLNSTLGELGLLIEGVPSEVKGTVTEITDEVTRFGSVGGVLHDTKLKGTNEGNDLSKTLSRDGVRAVDGSPAVGEGVEGITRVVNVSGKVDSVTGDDLAKEGKLTDTPVLDLDVTKTVETVLVGIIEHTKGIEESKWGLGTKLRLEGAEGGGGLGDRGGREGGGRGDGGGKDGRLHFDCFW